MDQINSEILRQFEAKGLTINEGIAVDARLVKSASRPISNKDIDDLRKKQDTPQGKLDKNGKPKKYSRDLDSNWTIKNDVPHYGLKEHAAVDTNHGFILATTLSRPRSTTLTTSITVPFSANIQKRQSRRSMPTKHMRDIPTEVS